MKKKSGEFSIKYDHWLDSGSNTNNHIWETLMDGALSDIMELS